MRMWITAIELTRLRRKRNNGNMPSRLLPLFPLRVVVFPRTSLPLHIFEERYKEMVGDALRDRTEFGIVLAKEEGIVNAGCTVTVDKVLNTYPDGRMDILTRGQRRFEILVLNEEKEYLRGEVEYFDDEEPASVSEDLLQRTLGQYEKLVEIQDEQTFREPDLQDPQISFQLAQSLDDLDFLSLLLRSRSESSRLKELSEYLAQYIPRQRQTLRMRKLAPTNGFGGKPAGLQ
jgi:Lon protease-like protein